MATARLMDHRLIIVGASVRSAAFSARRAGIEPYCADLFADIDLGACCHVTRVDASAYPDGLEDAAARLPAGPLSYTGALENQPELVERIAGRRPLWGNGANVLRRVRDPFEVSAALDRAGLPCPRVRPAGSGEGPSGGTWLVKPLAGSGGRGVRPAATRDEPTALPSVLGTQYSGVDARKPERGAPYEARLDSSRARPVCSRHVESVQLCYLQEFIVGLPCAASFVAAAGRAALLGLTRQLVGEPAFNAKPFHYCGSVGPLPIDRRLFEQLTRLGAVLAAEFRLTGLFGVDGIVADGAFWPVEINPRYTASVEVLELATGVPLMALHRDACLRSQLPRDVPEIVRFKGDVTRRIIGKAVLFAPSDCAAADLRGRLNDALERSGRWPVPPVADVPYAGERIARGHPICTAFAVGDSVAACRQMLIDSGAALYAAIERD